MKSVPLFSLLVLGYIFIPSWRVAYAGDGVQRLTGGHEQSRILEEYLASGQIVEGRLISYGDLIPPDLLQSYADTCQSAVYLDNPGYPLPFSQPVVVVTVARNADFKLAVYGESGEMVDQFEFAGISSGLYFFCFKRPIWPRERCEVRLIYKGNVIGTKMSDFAVLNGFK